MKKLMMTAATLALMATGAGKAMAADQAINIGATVTSFCAISNPLNISPSIPINGAGLTTGGPATAPTIDVLCNNASTVSLTSSKGAVTLGGATETSLGSPPTGFRNSIQYTASINGGAGPVALDTSTGVEGVNTSGSFNGGAVSTTGTA